jgi:hypothetical protein
MATGTEQSVSYHFSSEELIRSCPLPASMFSHKSHNHTSLTIRASNKKHLEYGIMENMIEMIGRQLHNLEVEQNKGITSLHLDDITVFHSGPERDTAIYFAITNEANIHEIDDDNELEITTPHDVSNHSSKNIAFYSPEHKEQLSKKVIPYKLHFKSSYYSVGLLCMYCYVSRSSKPDDSEFETLLAPIINTKIYWFLKQVLQEDPSERRYICV